MVQIGAGRLLIKGSQYARHSVLFSQAGAKCASTKKFEFESIRDVFFFELQLRTQAYRKLLFARVT